MNNINRLAVANCDTRLCRDSSLQTKSPGWLICGIDKGEFLFIVQFETDYEGVVKAIDRDGQAGYLRKIALDWLVLLLQKIL